MALIEGLSLFLFGILLTRLSQGVAGMFSGAVFGIMRFQPPLITSIGAGVQWFCLGSSYYGKSRGRET